ncbi:DUF3267 domain-containing protein [Fictibacillus iocasae]|uniref:DUF3267 domain-containing protein n=1 Tax=Fictibacillus iocasae TaxID=2715437 RepID=A0ABW2NQS1_9BACL
MNCWKSINIKKNIGTQRLFILSVFAGLAFFMFFYDLFLLLYSDSEMVEAGGWPFVFAAAAALPLHKLAHCLPLWLTGVPAKLVYKKASGFPSIHCHFKQALTIKVMKLSVLSPFILITSACLAGAYTWPVYMPFFITFAAVNIGLCISDFIYYSCLLSAPKEAMVEDHDVNGFFILVRDKVS